MGLFDNIIGLDATTDAGSVSQTGDSGSAGQGNPPADDGASLIISTPPLASSPLSLETTLATEIPDIDIGGDMTTVFMTDTSLVDTSVDTSVVETPIIPETPLESLTPTPETPLESLITPMMDMSTVAPIQTGSAGSLDERISGFVADLERLRADDEMVLQTKEAAIADLESQMKDLQKEVKKIEADEKKIEATIASLTSTPKSK